jgi:type IV pilus assembly protein PilW
MLVSVALGSVILAAVTTTYITQSRFYGAQEQVNEMQQNARGAIDLMAREIKLAGYDPIGTAITTSNGIPYSPTQLEILADLDGDGDTADVNERVFYRFDQANKRILRETGGVTTTLADNISAFGFSYRDSTGVETSTTAAIRQIELSVTAQTSNPDPNTTGNGGYHTYQLTSLITPQNLCYKSGSCP